MDLNTITRLLNDEGDPTETLQRLSSISTVRPHHLPIQKANYAVDRLTVLTHTESCRSCLRKKSEIEEATQTRTEALQNCLQFVQSSAKHRRYRCIPPVLKFIRKANFHDDWLTAASLIILPKLNILYCTILTEADPNTQKARGKVNVAISTRVKQDKHALRALCAVFEVCFGFCDIIDETIRKHLGIFLKSSAAVLFGSDFQRQRDTLNDTDYAMDELARYSSYALSNIMLTYPEIIPIAKGILAKRIGSLFNFLRSSPELSINRSIVLILRTLYEEVEDQNHSESNSCKQRIEEELSSSVRTGRSLLKTFRDMDIVSDDVGSEAERVSSKLTEKRDDEDLCFKSKDCRVQVKRLSPDVRRRVPFQAASLDWNRNSIVIHRDHQLPEYRPFFAIDDFAWKRGRQEFQLRMKGRGERGDTQIIIRFGCQSLSDSRKEIIEQRIRHIMNLVAFQHGTDKPKRQNTRRKMSAAEMDISEPNDTLSSTTEPDAEDVGQESDEDFAERSNLFESGQKKHVFHEVPMHEVYKEAPDCQQFNYSKEEHGLRVMNPGEGDSDAETVENRHEPNISKPTDAIPAEGLSSKAEVSSCSGESNKSSSCDISSHEKDCPVPLFDEEERENSNNVKSKDGHELPHSKDYLVMKETNVAALGSVSEKSDSHDTGNFNQTQNHQVKNATRRRGGENVNMEVEPVVEDESNLARATMQDPDAPIHVLPGEVSQKKLTSEDTQLIQKLQAAIRQLRKWKQSQCSKTLLDAKANITTLREKRAEQDRDTVTLLVTNLSKTKSIQERKLKATAGRIKKSLSEVRQRFAALKSKAVSSKERLNVLKSQTEKEITLAEEGMQQERKELTAHLEKCVTESRRRSQTRAKKSSVFQSLARLLQES